MKDGFDYIILYLPDNLPLTLESIEWLRVNTGPGGGRPQFITDEAVKWAVAYESSSGHQIWFKDADKAMLFKLTWF